MRKSFRTKNGVREEYENGKVKYFLTDCAISSVNKSFGMTDLGVAGVIFMLSNHVCNDICSRFGLRSDLIDQYLAYYGFPRTLLQGVKIQKRQGTTFRLKGMNTQYIMEKIECLGKDESTLPSILLGVANKMMEESGKQFPNLTGLLVGY